MKLKEFIKKRGKNTQQVADYLGILRGSLSKKLNHKAPFRVSEALKIKRFLDMTDEEFFDIFEEFI